MRWGTDRQIIRALESRLRWFMNEADQDEFDSKEVTAIVDLLEAMDPVEKREGDFYTASKAQDRFWTFYAFRERPEEDEMPYPLAMRIQMRLRHFFRSSIVVNGAFIVALVVAMILGGTAVVYAQKEGLFQWVNKNENGNDSYTSPALTADYNVNYYYTTFEEIPITYIHLFWVPNGIPEEFNVSEINLYDCSVFLRTECQFKNGESFIKISRKEYNNTIALKNNSALDEFKMLDSEKINGLDVDVYKKVNSDYTEYVVCFYIDNVVYTINSNIEIAEIKELIANNIDSF